MSSSPDLLNYQKMAAIVRMKEALKVIILVMRSVRSQLKLLSLIFSRMKMILSIFARKDTILSQKYVLRCKHLRIF